jgi:hypothetical protein
MDIQVSAEASTGILSLPNDLMYLLVSKLDFRNKVVVGMVCKQWGHLLRAGTARHWNVRYDVDKIVSSTAFSGTAKLQMKEFSKHPSAVIARWVTTYHSQ